jgi:hypothetical protein
MYVGYAVKNGDKMQILNFKRLIKKYMKREIKFRVWDNYNQQLLYPNSNGYFIGSGSYSLWQVINNDPSKDLKCMQCTGLKDKNGKEIYEGDIVAYVLPTSGEDLSGVSNVRYSNGGFVVDNLYIDKLRLEVIGNVHETPKVNV